ncbi:hypothetical protein D3C76_1650320 [compost metagenome]
MCGKFRHQIVHAGGFLPADKESFVNECLTEAGISGSARDKHRTFVERYIGTRGERSVLDFLDVPHPQAELRSFGAHFDICADFLKALGSYAHLMISCR